MKNYFTATTLEKLKKEYKKLAMENHPDRGGNEEIMKKINNEYEKLFKILKDTHNINATNDTTGKTKKTNEMSKDYVNAIMTIINIEDITIELCGSWLWVSWNTFKHKEIFKKAGYEWSKGKKEWYWKPSSQEGYKFYRGNKSKDYIRKTFGSEKIDIKQKQCLV
ncbi:MAG: hypothetical protein RLZZ577_84 [Bacteroidota bacterium]|jgi:curved DNA-binding protein CbpA